MMGMLRRKRLGEQRGSALIITILMVTIISTISFTISALSISEFRKAGILQDSIAAYYAAESGIEQGLMQYRLWHDAEVSSQVMGEVLALQGAAIGPELSPTETDGTPQTYRLDGGAVAGGPALVTDPANRGTSYYDLKMWYKGYSIGDVSSGGYPAIGSSPHRIYRDSALNLVVNGASKLEIKWKPEQSAYNNTTKPLYKFFLEVVTTDLSTNELKRSNFVDTRVPGAAEDSVTKIDDLPSVASVRIKPWDMKYVDYSLIFKDDSGNPVKFDNQVSFIEATGSVGKAKRKLRIGINRASGTVLELQDFLLYAGDGSIILQ